MKFKNYLKSLLPVRLIPFFMALNRIEPEVEINQVTREQRNKMVLFIKRFPLTVDGSLGFRWAMITQGGIPLKEIKSRTMESAIVPNLYLAGDILDGAAPSGGYNLQKAFSTGAIAGEESCADC